MVDRRNAYYGAIVQDLDILSIGQDYMVGIANLSQAVLGSSAALVGLSVSPVANSLSLTVGPGQIYQQAQLEATPIGSLGTDATVIYKQGNNFNPTVAGPLQPPNTAGYSCVVLVQVQYQDSDGALQVLPYRNAANPSVPFSGPGNNGIQQSTSRQGIVAIGLKYGAASPTGTQITPTPDVGWVGLATVTLAYGQTTIASGNVSAYGAPPFIPTTLPAIPANIQNGAWVAYDDTGTTNAIVITPVPAVPAYQKGQTFRVRIAYANTGATSIAISGLTPVAVVRTDGTALRPKDIIPNMEAVVTFDGTNFQILCTSPYGWASGRYYGRDTGSVNNVIVALDASFVAYLDGTIVGVYINHTNTGASFLTCNNLSPVKITIGAGVDIAAGDLVTGTIAWFTIDTVGAQLLNPQSWHTGGSGASLPANWNTIIGPIQPYWIAVASATTTAPPGSPVAGTCYLIPAGATGAWSSNVGKIAQWTGAAWVYASYPVGSATTAGDTLQVYMQTSAGNWVARMMPSAGLAYFLGQF